MNDQTMSEDYRPSDCEAPIPEPFLQLVAEEVEKLDVAGLWKAGFVCSKAAELVAGNREKTHGLKLANFTNIARMWNAILLAKGIKQIAGNPLDAHDVANMMEAMKIARRYTGTPNLDDYVDGAGYAGVAAEVANR